MATIIIFAEGETPERVLSYLQRVDPAPYRTRTDALIEPDLSAVTEPDFHHWKHVAGSIVDMTQAEKDALDAAIAAAADAHTRSAAQQMLQGFEGQALFLRAFADIIKDEINLLRAEHGLAPRTLLQLRNAILARINDGTVDS